MKLKLLIPAFLFTLTAFAQDQQPMPLEYTQVVQVEGASAKELYNRSLQWFALAFRSANEVLQYKDENMGKVVAKASMNYDPRVFVSNACTRGYINYSIVLEFKDGKYKYTITDFYHVGNGISCQEQPYVFGFILNSSPCNSNQYSGFRAPRPWLINVCDDIKRTISENINPLISSLKAEMTKPASAGSSDDW